MSNRWDLVIDAGASEVVEVAIDADLVGGTASYLVREGGPRGRVILAKSEAGGITLAADSLTLTLAPEDTGHLHGDYWHALRATTSSGDTQVTNHGTLSIRSRGV